MNDDTRLAAEALRDHNYRDENMWAKDKSKAYAKNCDLAADLEAGRKVIAKVAELPVTEHLETLAEIMQAWDDQHFRETGERRSTEVQDDLRRWAKALRALLPKDGAT